MRSADGDEPPRAGAGRARSLPVGKVASGERSDGRADGAATRLGGLARRAHRAPHASRSRRRARTCVGRWLQVKRGAAGHALVRHAGQRRLARQGARRAARAAADDAVPIGLVASGTHTAGAVAVAAVPRTWELLPDARAGELVPRAALPAAARRAHGRARRSARSASSRSRSRARSRTCSAAEPAARHARAAGRLAAARRAHARLPPARARLPARHRGARRAPARRPPRAPARRRR